jgi:hypothetical protein
LYWLSVINDYLKSLFDALVDDVEEDEFEHEKEEDLCCSDDAEDDE